MKLLTCTSKNANVPKLCSIGIVLLVMSALIIVSDPLQMIVESQLAMRTGSLIFNLWRKPPLDVLIAVYIFNVTNLDAFLSGADAKLRVEEVGPYVYQEFLENHNVTFNANNTVTYNPKREVKFISERSVGDPKVDRIIAPNIPYMGITSMATSFSIFAALGLRALTKRLESKAILEMTVHEYLWGYEDDLVHLASKMVPSFINFESFGVLDRMFDEGHNVVTMNLPDTSGAATEDPQQPFTIDNWNGHKGINYWGYTVKKNATPCNTLEGAYEGTLFPRNLGEGDTFRVYRKAFCRTLSISYAHRTKISGIEGYTFHLDANSFDSDANDPGSSCFCQNKQCMKKGLGNITPCYYNIPLAISFPHFFSADPSLLDAVEGLKPNEEKHKSEVVIQPRLGVPMRVRSRFQINLLMDDIKFNSDMSRFRHTVLPIFWLDIGVESLPTHLVLLLNLLFNICPYVQLGLVIVLMAGGVYLVAAPLLLSFCWQSPWRALPTVAVEQANARIMPLLRVQPCKVSDLGKQQCKDDTKVFLPLVQESELVLETGDEKEFVV